MRKISLEARIDIEAKLGLDVFKLDKERHITIHTDICNAICENKACLYVCPAHLYSLDDQGDNFSELGGMSGVWGVLDRM